MSTKYQRLRIKYLCRNVIGDMVTPLPWFGSVEFKLKLILN